MIRIPMKFLYIQKEEHLPMSVVVLHTKWFIKNKTNSGLLEIDSGETGSDIENEANACAVLLCVTSVLS